MSVKIFSPFFLVGFLLTTIEASAVHLKRDDMARAICHWVNDQSDFNYDVTFAPLVQGLYPKETMKGLLANFYQAHGPCMQTLSLLENSQVNSYFLEMADGVRADLFIGVNSENKIDKFYFGGALPSDQKIDWHEALVPMRDGVLLRTLIFQKSDGLKKPVILDRTPYFYFMYGALPIATLYSGYQSLIEKGYAYAVQAIRGTGGSQGEFKLFNPKEREDGWDFAEWISQQNFSNEKAAFIGGSYNGFTAMAAATKNPPSVKVVIASSYFTELKNFGGNPNGAAKLFLLQWLNYVTLGQGSPMELFLPLDPKMIEKLQPEFDTQTYDLLMYGKKIPEWQNFVLHSADESFWKERSILMDLPKIQIPTYHISGMNRDFTSQDTVSAFEFLEGFDRPFHHLVIGDWDHLGFAYANPFLAQKIEGWLEHYLKEKPMTVEARVQVMKEDSPNFNEARWEYGETYPLATMVFEKLYLSEGDLSPRRPKTDLEASYMVDPSKWNGEFPEKTSSEISKTFFTKPFEQAITLWGDLNLQVFLSSESFPTDLIVAIVKKSPDHTIKKIGLSAIKVSKNQRQPVALHFGPLKEAFAPGDSLGLSFTGQMFPSFLRSYSKEKSAIPSVKVKIISSAQSSSFIEWTHQ